MKSYKDLRVWQISIVLIKKIYEITDKLPKREDFALSSQMRRSAISIPSNIAEGSKRNSRADFKQFCKIALGSAAELETQLLIMEMLYPSIIISDDIEKDIEDIQKMLSSLSNKLVPLQTKQEKR